jgi:SPP1 family predicted phage head-tail adaptor
LYNEIVEFGNITETIEHGESIPTIEWREVFARIDSVRQSEFYQAATVGLKPELIIQTPALNYNDEEKVRYNGKLYEIIRIYKKDNMAELTVAAFTGAVV